MAIAHVTNTIPAIPSSLFLSFIRPTLGYKNGMKKPQCIFSAS